MPRVLLVADDRALLRAWQAPLQRAGVEVRVALGARAGLRALCADPEEPDVVAFEHPLSGAGSDVWLGALERVAEPRTRLVALAARARDRLALAPWVARRRVEAPASAEGRHLLQVLGVNRRKPASRPAGREERLVARVHGLVDELFDVAQLARQDRLTGLPNRARFEEDAPSRRAQAARRGLQLGVLLVDIDSFKRFNALQSVGYEGGDRAIRFVADALLRASRLGETIYRYGGDEFAVLIADATRAGLDRAAARLKRAVLQARSRVPVGDPLATLTVSLGMTVLGPTARMELGDALQKAASGVQRSKERGGGRLSLAGR
jgi:diguanylate cyclase (GGDEF)-like protein